jgi:negative regulator of sigma E activity
MRRRREGHAAWRDLIAARRDRPLTRAELRGLTAHLRSCAECRQVEHDYREQRALLRSMPQRLPPRDMWARTSAALDREVARGAYRSPRFARGSARDFRFGETRRPAAPSAALLTTLAAMGVVAAVAVMQLMPGLRVTAPARATPFAVDPQQFAFIGNEAADVYIYQTRVGHVCPPTAPDCEVAEGIVRTAVNLPARMRARNVALSPTGHQLALVGHYVDQDLIAVLILPADEPAAGSSSDPGSQTPEPADSSAPSTDAPATPTDVPSPGESATPPETPPSDQPTPDANPASSLPAPSVSAPPASAVPGLRVLAILEDVASAGAQPAWSPSGAMLAFSAMPADGSQGPDVYVWAPNDERARPITNDHGSYFASWSGERIVASQAISTEPQSVLTVVIDPGTLEERVVDAAQMWLPTVNPAASHAVAWSGEVDFSSGLAVPRTGTLFMVEWAAIDPFAGEPDGGSNLPQASPADGPTPDVITKNEATASPTEQPSSAPAADATPAPGSTSAPPTLTPDGMVALDLGRDPVSAPVLDWQVRWSSDGQVLGIWIADTAGSTWGRLAVLAIDPQTNQISAAEPLLSATLARRGFTLGFSRVAWVAPAEDNPDGELRIRTWGDDGVGGLLLQPRELQEVVPAF